MPALRKASAYSKKIVVPYTRVSKKRHKSFIKTVPNQKIVKFTMGKHKEYAQDAFPHELTLISKENVQLRHNAMEACRQFVNKKLDKELAGQYFFKIIPFPHHIQRENKMLTGAGADRMQTGMQFAFGKSVGKAAILKEGSKIFMIAVSTEKGVLFARNVLKQIKSKLPCKVKILYEDKSKKE